MNEDSWKPDLYVLARLVDALSRNGPMKKTNLQMSARLNYAALVRYTDWMCEHGLTEMAKGSEGELVVLTKKGQDAQETFVDWLGKLFASLNI